jgi:hypothetical protein
MPVNKEVELASTARTGLIVLSSLLAWLCEALLMFHLRSARNSPDGAPALLYLLPVVNLLPWASAMQSLWRVRKDVRSGALDAAGASRCFWMIDGILSSTYVAPVIIEMTLESTWRFTNNVLPFR